MFELILLVTIGDLVQQGVTQEDVSVTGAVLAAGTLGFWALVFATASFRFPRTRPVIDGIPVIVLRDGEPLDDVLHLERIPLDDLKAEAREQGIADLPACGSPCWNRTAT